MLLNSGWTQYWSSSEQGQGKFLGMDKNGIQHFPGWSAQAARMMNERSCRGLGANTISIDAGYKYNIASATAVETAFDAHLEILHQDKWLLENVKILPELPSKGATLLVAR